MKGCSTSNLVGAVIPNRPCLISKTLHSSARFTETERRRATYILSAIFYILVAMGDAFAWDADDFDSQPFHQSTFNQQNSANDYGYKNTYQSTTTRQSSVIDFGGPKRADSLESTVHLQPVSRPRIETVQESIDRQNNEFRKFSAESQRQFEEQKARHDADYAKQEAENNAWEARQWKDVETVAGAFVASGPYYKAGQRCVNTDKGLVYSTGNGCVVAPDGFYYRSGNLWVGPNEKLAGQSGSGDNRYIWGNDGDNAISAGRGYFTERGYSWPAYPSQTTRPVTSTWRSR